MAFSFNHSKRSNERPEVNFIFDCMKKELGFDIRKINSQNIRFDKKRKLEYYPGKYTTSQDQELMILIPLKVVQAKYSILMLFSKNTDRWIYRDWLKLNVVDVKFIDYDKDGMTEFCVNIKQENDTVIEELLFKYMDTAFEIIYQNKTDYTKAFNKSDFTVGEVISVTYETSFKDVDGDGFDELIEKKIVGIFSGMDGNSIVQDFRESIRVIQLIER